LAACFSSSWFLQPRRISFVSLSFCPSKQSVRLCCFVASRSRHLTKPGRLLFWPVAHYYFLLPCLAIIPSTPVWPTKDLTPKPAPWTYPFQHA
jgi:hypothetical protein